MAKSDYISREAVMDALLHEQYGYLCEDAINAIPAADVVEVDVKDFRMKKAIQMLSHYYSVAKKSGRSEDPLSYALYMTWRITDEMSKSREMLTEV